MKFFVEPLRVDPTNPFAGDSFERQKFGKSLTNLLQNCSGRVVLAVDAPWGGGKSTFARMWEAQLRNREEYPVRPIYFDAFASDHEEDPFISFSGEICLAAKAIKKSQTTKKSNRLAKAAGAVGKLSKVAFLAGGKALAKRAFTEEGVEEIKEGIDSIIEYGADSIGDLVTQRIKDYGKSKQAEEKFRNELIGLASDVAQQQNGFPMTIIVDELDRCRPDYALRLLERIKHYFDVENLAFVLLLNIHELKKTITATYGISRPDAYLSKFIHWLGRSGSALKTINNNTLWNVLNMRLIETSRASAVSGCHQHHTVERPPCHATCFMGLRCVAVPARDF